MGIDRRGDHRAFDSEFPREGRPIQGCSRLGGSPRWLYGHASSVPDETVQWFTRVPVRVEMPDKAARRCVGEGASLRTELESGAEERT